MAEKSDKAKIIISLVPKILILTIFLGLFSFSGFLETYRVQAELTNEKIIALSRDGKEAIESALSGGLPLSRYQGFPALAKSLLADEKAIRRIEVSDNDDKSVFEQEGENDTGTVQTVSSFTDTQIKLGQEGYVTAENEISYLFTFPLNNQKDIVGNLHLIVSKSEAGKAVFNEYTYIWLGIGGAVLLFSLLFFIFLRSLTPKIKAAITIIWCIFFLALGAFITYTMYTLAAQKINEKLETISQSLARKLDATLAGTTDPDNLRTAIRLLNEYKKNNPDISFISLMNSDQELAHTDYEQEKPPVMNEDQYFIVKKELHTASPGTDGIDLLLGMEKNLLITKLLSGLENTALTLLASLVISLSLLNLAMAARRQKELPDAGGEPAEVKSPVLELVLPLSFLAVFAEGLLVSFLPQFLKNTVEQAGLDQQMTSLIFAVYFAAFWVGLLPARLLAKRGSAKITLAVGALLIAAGYLGLAFYTDYLYIIISRSFCGLGQGFIFAAVLTLYQRQFPAAPFSIKSIFPFWGYTGGMLLGAASGALLASYLNISDVFIVAGGIGAFLAVYSLIFIAGLTNPAALPATSFKNILHTLGDGEFFKSFFFIGIIARAIVSGVICFTLPLLLKDKFTLVQTGQLIFVYFAFLLVTSLCLAKPMAGSKHTRVFMFLASQIAGFSLYVLGFMNWEHFSALVPFAVDQTILLIAGLALLGFAHGLLYVPLSAHLLQTKSAYLWSETSLYSAYSFLESVGLIAGPLAMAQLLIFLDFNALSLSWMGILSIIAGILFILGRFTPGTPEVEKLDEKITQV